MGKAYIWAIRPDCSTCFESCVRAYGLIYWRIIWYALPQQLRISCVYKGDLNSRLTARANIFHLEDSSCDNLAISSSSRRFFGEDTLDMLLDILRSDCRGERSSHRCRRCSSSARFRRRWSLTLDPKCSSKLPYVGKLARGQKCVYSVRVSLGTTRHKAPTE